MPLKIENIKFDKEKYIFGEDKEMKISFELVSDDLVSDDKEYKLNGINIDYGIIIFLRNKEYIKKTFHVKIGENMILYANEIKIYQFTIPINYPNVGSKKNIQKNDENINEEDNYYNDQKYIYNNDIKIKNYVLISIDKKFNLFNLNKDIYPTIIDPNADTIIKKIFGDTIDKSSDSNYINIGIGELGKKDFISKKFYDYLINNYKLFRIQEVMRKNLKIFSYILGSLFFLLIIILIIGENISNFTFIIVYISFLIFLRKKSLISQIFFTIYFLLIFLLNKYKLFIIYKEAFINSITVCLFLSMGLILIFIILKKTIISKIIYIKFKNSKTILNLFKTEQELYLSNIFEFININYYENFSFNFRLYFTNIIKITTNTGKETYVDYKTINFIKLLEINGNNNNLSNINSLLLNINKYSVINTEKIGRKCEIFYKIFYKFESNELTDKTGEITVSNSINIINFLNNLTHK